MRHSLPRLLVGILCLTITGCGSTSHAPSPTGPAVGQPKLVASCPELSGRRRTGDDLYVLHGLWSDPEAMAELVKSVAQLEAYRRIYTVSYRDDQTIRLTGAELARAVRANSPTTCDLIGHSLGGLVIRWALEREGLGPKVRKAWLLGTPNLGSTLAHWVAGGALDDLKPDSETLHILNDGPRITGAAYSYLTIAGNLTVAGQSTQSDGVVAVNVANWTGLGLHAQSLTRSIVSCSHFGLKNSPAALNQLSMMIRVQSSLQ